MSSFDPSRIPAWLAPVCEERSVSHSARRCVVGQPAGHGRCVAVAHRPAQHGQREPVDLEEDDPGDVGAGDDALPARDPLRDPDRGHVVRAENDGEHDAHRRDHERRKQRPAEAVDPEHPLGHVGGDEEDDGVRDQHEQEAEHERERQAQRGEQRRDDRVQRRDDHRDEQRAPEAVDVDAGQERGGHHQGDARGEPRGEQREQPPAGTLRLPGRGPAVRGLGAVSHLGSSSSFAPRPIITLVVRPVHRQVADGVMRVARVRPVARASR